MQQVQDVRLGGDARFKCQFHCTQNVLFVVLKNQRQNVDHLSVTAFFTQHVILQLTEGIRHLRERRAIPKCARFALDNSEIVAPIIDDLAGLAMRSLDDPRMLANRLPFSDHDQPFGIDMQTDTAVRKAGRNAVAIAFERDQASG